MPKKYRKRKLEEQVEVEEPVVWNQKTFFSNELKNEMETMWEIPQIFHFLYLTKDILHIRQLSMYEMERMLIIPKASKQLANIMTSLLSSPIYKPKIKKIPPMPYEFWTNILAYKMKTWFQVYEGKRRNTIKVLDALGIDPEFWKVFPDAPLLDGADFDDLSFKQKVWLLKAVCDTAMYSRKTVQDEIAKQPLADQFETVLGTDRYGARYIYFPQFLNTDLRVYRISFDNNILSTVKPVKKQETEENLETASNVTEENVVVNKKVKQKRKKLRWKNGFTTKIKKRVSKCGEKHLNDCKDNEDTSASSLINEDTSLSTTSTSSNNNNTINSDAINEELSKNVSKSSEINIESNHSHSNGTTSSGYETNSSLEMVLDEDLSKNIFKGFPDNNKENKCDLEVSNGLMNDSKSEVNVDRRLSVEVLLPQTSQNKLNSNRQVIDAKDCVIGDETIDKTVDNLSTVSKTDDEKLNEIINAESLKLHDKNTSISHVMKTKNISSTSKSDDEKLSETRTSSHAAESSNTDSIEVTEKDKIVSRNGQFLQKEKLNYSTPNFAEMVNSDQVSESLDKNEKSENPKGLFLTELRCALEREILTQEFSFDTKKDTEEVTEEITEEIDNLQKEADDFNQMLQELGVSKFQLVADSVRSLRYLISTFPEVDCDNENDDINEDCDSNDENEDEAEDNENTPKCEVKLIRKLHELLSSVEEMEPALQESTKKAKSRMQREWHSSKNDIVEDQDSSGEGLGSNWWVLGSQGCPLSTTTGDATLLQTLPRPTVSRLGTTRVLQGEDDGKDERQSEYSNSVDSECKGHDDGNTKCEVHENHTATGEEGSQKTTESGEECKEGSAEREQTRRVLRVRGVSSYTEQFYSDDEIEENELEIWTDVEAVYAAPSEQADPSPSYFDPKVVLPEERTNDEDSDQDWILPSSRKRKSKRPSASRRLKTFQHKLQNIKVEEIQDAAESIAGTPSNTKSVKQKPRIKEVRICKVKNPNNPKLSRKDSTSSSFNNNSSTESEKAVVENNPKEIVPSANEETTCKVGNVDSVHSELDIKDEGPIYESTCQYENGYTVTQNYLMVKADQNSMNYYVMQSNPAAVVPPNAIVQPGSVVQNIISPLQQGYYVQGQNYIVQNPPSNVMHPPPFQTHGPQMLTPQQFVSPAGYVPYMVTGPPPQPGFPGPQIVGQVPHTIPVSIPFQPNSTPPIRPPQFRQPLSRYSHPPPNGAVIRSSMPIRGNSPRFTNFRTPKNIQQQKGPSLRTIRPKKPNAPTDNSSQKTTSVIVLSDSDDEIEMIITERNKSEAEADKTQTITKSIVEANTPSRQKSVISSDDTPPKGTIPPQIIQRMNQGGISITAIKPAPSIQNTNTQLVVVVNETGSHYALALPNGSKLILTPEQVAQIRASNGGKLIL